MKALTLMTTPFALLFASLLLASSAQAAATNDNETEAVSWYQIEVILFENMKPFEQDKEHVTLNISTPEQKLVLVKSEPMVDSQLKRLDTDELKLTKSFKALKRSKNYKVLEFAGWKQSLIKEQPGIPLTISAGEEFGLHHELEGTLTFRKSRYLHLQADLYMANFSEGSTINLKSWLLENDDIAAHISELHKMSNQNDITTEEALKENEVKPESNASLLLKDDSTTSPDDIEQENLKPNVRYIAKDVVHMNETRRMRSGEIHYLDHPKFGLLVTIEPTDPPFVYNETSQPAQ